MIQVDVFWSFAMGAQFAASAPKGIKYSNSMFVNKYFVFTVCFLSMIFAPSGIYLLWQHCGWETMWHYSKDMHGIWPCLFAHTNISLGVLGYVLAYKCIKGNQELLAHTLWVGAYTCMFAILSFGYDRFLYAGDANDWQNNVSYPLVDFFQSQVFYTLLVMSVFVLPPIYYAITIWPSEFGISSESKWQTINHAVYSFAKFTALGSAIYLGVFYSDNALGTWGLDRLVAFLVGQLAITFLTVAPMVLIKVTKQRKKVQ
ncbi:unnamed protein product [Owenia fusiformis]|uniref:Uncharacterized protein n=1 Tax=Owenia fusiformis TaxID=6347 RepID=A0A8S4PES3_OWEFU|nr:unnamed protein product [Owenia fusiformis]